MSENVNSAGLFHKRLNEARAAIYTADWEPDKAFKIAGQIVPYVSINKMKRNIAPALLKCGINFDVNFSNLELRTIKDSNFWSVECTVTFYDQDGNSMSSTAIGGCGANDKGINICQTYALKQVLSNVFLLIDGIEPEDLDNNTGGTFRKKTEEEVEEVKSEILSNKDVVKKAEPKKAEPKKEVPKEAPKTEQASTGDKAFFVPEGVILSELQKNTLKDVLARWEAAAKNGKVTPEEYNQMSMDYASMKDAKDVLPFLRKYRNVAAE